MQRHPSFAYQAVYRYLSQWIDNAASDQEQRLPSLRELAQRLKVSLSTIKYAYALLEDEGRICSRPRQGYFTRALAAATVPEAGEDLLDNLYAQARLPGRLALCSDAPAMLLSLEQPLLMTERELARRYTCSSRDYWQADQVFLGADLHSVVELALRALDLDGGVVLVESPCSWAILRQLRAARLRIIELPLDAGGRFDLQQVQALLQREPVRLAVLSSTVNIPHGSLMPAADKQQLCRWFAERGIWLLENDSYGAFSFVPGAARYRDFADPERLLVFASLDKAIGAEAPLSYVLSRSLGPALQRQCLERRFRLSPIRQKAVARLLSSGRVDQHVLKLRGMLQQRMKQLQQLLDEQAGGLLHAPLAAGGATLWVEARRPVPMTRVYERLLADGIVIAPGAIFSQQGLWQQHLRLSFTLDWSKDIQGALGQLARAVSQAS
ncbi:PLP-dependent aminotransferase family protein [Pseudomonas protegens]|uniref:aminotransferase-like domain-containing protein n=1 Tax=Pseudomonas protegens TaxID=380021 RepID=UPI0021CA7DC1|nr:PLP-dependent aminotransferase family protein [Pseudomonas protegens]MCU1765150.1 PLP-dependent aminotransferase family protein [Pseudomonas protegens]